MQGITTREIVGVMFSTDNTASLYHCRELKCPVRIGYLFPLIQQNIRFKILAVQGQPEGCPKQEKLTQEIYSYTPRGGLPLESG